MMTLMLVSRLSILTPRCAKGRFPALSAYRIIPLARISVHELLISGKHLQIAVLTTTIGVFLASLLPITVSGLYIPVNYSQDIKVYH